LLTGVAKQGKEIMLVVGEASGDIHGAHLVQALQERDAKLKVYGVAGEQLQQTHFEVLLSVSKLTGMGLVELAGNLRNIWNAYRVLRRALRERRPNLLVLVDFPEFNLRLARLAKSLQIPVLYYVSPQIWAWRAGRIRQIAKRVDQMAVAFPFEVPLYERYGIPVTFVGHPLLDIVRVKQGREPVLRKLGMETTKPVIAVLPGSRQKELAYHLPIMLESAVRLRREREVQFFCVKASTVERSDIEAFLDQNSVKIPIVEEGRYDAVNAADLVWVASGTATLETALLLKPMIVMYRVSPITYGLARLLVSVDYIAMANIVAGKRIVPELVQADLNPERLLNESRSILDDTQRREGMIHNLAKVRNKLGSPGAAKRVAEIAASMMS
jgi:lipid-A-disaccharide synthase